MKETKIESIEMLQKAISKASKKSNNAIALGGIGIVLGGLAIAGLEQLKGQVDELRLNINSKDEEEDEFFDSDLDEDYHELAPGESPKNDIFDSFKKEEN